MSNLIRIQSLGKVDNRGLKVIIRIFDRKEKENSFFGHQKSIKIKLNPAAKVPNRK